jgi:hypothetical protein
MSSFVLAVENQSLSLFLAIRAFFARLTAALPTAAPAWMPLVVEADEYVGELNRALQAHPAYEKGMQFKVPADLADYATVDDIAHSGPARLDGVYRKVMEDVSLRFELV